MGEQKMKKSGAKKNNNNEIRSKVTTKQQKRKKIRIQNLSCCVCCKNDLMGELERLGEYKLPSGEAATYCLQFAQKVLSPTPLSSRLGLSHFFNQGNKV